MVNFGNPFEAATSGAVKAMTHRVVRGQQTRFSITFFQGVLFEMTMNETRALMPESVREMRKGVEGGEATVSAFLDARWDSLGESQLRKWIRSHPDVGRRWYGKEVVRYYMS